MNGDDDIVAARAQDGVRVGVKRRGGGGEHEAGRLATVAWRTRRNMVPGGGGGLSGRGGDLGCTIANNIHLPLLFFLRFEWWNDLTGLFLLLVDVGRSRLNDGRAYG